MAAAAVKVTHGEVNEKGASHWTLIYYTTAEFVKNVMVPNIGIELAEALLFDRRWQSTYNRLT